MANRTTNLQVRKADLVTKLQAKLKEVTKQFEAYKVAKNAYEVALNEWSSKALSDVKNIKSIKLDSYGQLTVVLVDKVAKTRPKDTSRNMPYNDWNAEHTIKHLNQTLIVLSMVDGDTVPMRYYDDVASYLA